jgi:hypothetical protein
VGVEVDFALLRLERLRARRVLADERRDALGASRRCRPAMCSTMPQMPFHKLPPGEITRLMLNRGSLLLMNQQRLQ